MKKDKLTRQLVTWSARHTEKSCDALTVWFDGVVTSWPASSQLVTRSSRHTKKFVWRVERIALAYVTVTSWPYFFYLSWIEV